MRIVNDSLAGTLESSDAVVRVSPHDTLEVTVVSTVEAQFGAQIRAVVAETLAPAGSPRIIDGDGHEMRLHIGLIAHPEHRSAATDHLLDVLQTEIERTYGQG